MSAPSSTYRLQVTPTFTLFDAAAVVPYLAELGVGAVYTSPVLTSAEGSTHGYDTVDPATIDEARGGEDGWAALVSACREHGLGLVVDVVPNHMGVRLPRDNKAWWGLLRDGRESEYADWFDVDWSAGQLVLPVLGSADDVANVRMDIDGTEPVLRYHEHIFPLAPGSFSPSDAVPDVLARQHYRLADWREANSSLNYRRFFAIVDLAGVRVDDPAVFEATHARVLRWIADGEVTGLRVDHPDGLRDPGGYLAQLRSHLPAGWIVSEKILAAGEELPAWEHDGTVGYDALREVTAVLTPPATAPEWDRLWREIGGGTGTAQEAEDSGKLEMATTQFVAEARRIASLIAATPAVTADEGSSVADAVADAVAPRPDVVAALQEIASQFRVYRTYLPFGREYLDGAVARAKARREDLAATIDEILPVLTDPENEAAQRFQQFTGPVMAKGVEDTAFYRWNRLLPLNEVGGDPAHDAGSLAEFHAAMERRQAGSPRGMTTLSTHDTKRSEDVRAAMLALAERPEVFEPFARLLVEKMGIDDAGFAFALAQTAACGPVDADRLGAWAVKALREAGVSSTWTHPDKALEAHVVGTIAAVLDPLRETPDWDDVAEAWEATQWALAETSGTVALSQKAIQLMMPGIPDVYQGTEFLDDSLVDPDNRRPVDFDARRAALADALPTGTDPHALKQWLVRQVLRLRRDRPEAFAGYQALHASGDAAAHCVAFNRGDAILVATRLPHALHERDGWGDTILPLPDGGWIDVLTDRLVVDDAPAGASKGVRLADLLSVLPVAILARP